MTPLFRDRREAAGILAKNLQAYARRSDVVVLGLPRGGVPVAFEVARALNAPLDVFVVRKVGVPGQEELAMGAVAPGGVRLVNWELVAALGIDDTELESAIRRQERELARRQIRYRGATQPISPTGRIALLVDDGLATGASMRAAVLALREQKPARIVVAAPVGSRSACSELRDVADDVVCAATPEPFFSVGLWYANFEQTTDEEVRELLELAARERAERARAAPAP